MKMQHVDADMTITLERVRRRYIVTSREAGSDYDQYSNVAKTFRDALQLYVHLICANATCYAASDAEREAILKIVS